MDFFKFIVLLKICLEDHENQPPDQRNSSALRLKPLASCFTFKEALLLSPCSVNRVCPHGRCQGNGRPKFVQNDQGRIKPWITKG